MAKAGGRLKFQKPGISIKIPDLTPQQNVNLDDKFVMR